MPAPSVNLLDDAKIAAALCHELLKAARGEIRAIRVESGPLRLHPRSGAPHARVAHAGLGASPRAAICLLRVAQAFAAFEDRDYVIPDDVKRAALPALRHRILLKPEAELEGFDADRVLNDVVAAVAVPRQ
jgi:MoxR-like ATPase